MEKIKLMAIFGTRPEAIKMAPLIKELQLHEEFETKVCVTAQHREILDQVLEMFDIEPDYDLDIMKENQSLTGITTRVIKKLEDIFKTYKPDMVLVHGDTTTTFAASLAAFYSHILVGHVEAGLRTFNKHFPFPEEMNRRLTASLADLHFSPTRLSKENLLKENVEEEKIIITGNTVIDAMKTTIEENYIFQNDILNSIDFDNKKVVMVTAHRRENWGEGINNICVAINSIVESYEDVEFIYLVHPNPIVKNEVEKHLKNNKKVHLLSPLDTKETHNLMSKVYMIMTDSGGIQEEAPHLGKPVLVLRDVTERPEATEAGTVKLVGTDSNSIFNSATEILMDKEVYYAMSNAINPYGDGQASKRIADSIKFYFGINKEKTKEFSYMGDK